MRKHRIDKFGFKCDPKIISSGIIISVVMIFVLPLCGFLFDCGCTWLWAEMDENCNIHDLEKIHKCPWCWSMILAIISIGLASLISVLVVHYSKVFDADNEKSGVAIISIYSILGLTVFFMVVFFAAWLSALFQNYPYFIL